jgi:hypothetical protein
MKRPEAIVASGDERLVPRRFASILVPPFLLKVVAGVRTLCHREAVNAMET